MSRPYVLKNPPPPEVRRERARKGAIAANSADTLIKRLAAQAPALTPAQAAKIRALLASVPDTGGEIE
ncbi:hypothetical protein ABT121_43580 [Streptomyces sp. NPDC001928]|uniref:hypothetical protein n=1 Tax=Streptomyces sp. NPDC001928 TaxID=3154404 RepID=UPI003333ED29